MYENFNQLNNSIFNEEVPRNLITQETKYAFEKAAIQKQQEEKETQLHPLLDNLFSRKVISK